MNSVSEESGDGSMLSSASFVSTSPSMKFARGARAYAAASMWFGNGDVMRAVTISLRYHAEMAASPAPVTFATPSSLTVATAPSLLENLAQRVTSSACPSEKCARTTSGCSSPGFSRAVGGNTSRRIMDGSQSAGAGVPAAIQFAITPYSGERGANRLPPPCDTASVGFSSIRLRPGSTLLMRRAAAWRVNVM